MTNKRQRGVWAWFLRFRTPLIFVALLAAATAWTLDAMTPRTQGPTSPGDASVALDAAPADEVAEAAPRDGRFELPDPPEGFVTEQVGDVRWSFPRGAQSLARTLQNERATTWAMLEEDFGVELDETLEVRIARNPEEMRELAPRFAPPPAYATGVAYTHHGLILLSAIAPETWEAPDLETVFVHELSHVALRRAARGHAMPRWFVEGVAVVHAGEQSFERIKSLWQGHRSGSLMPLDQLAGNFPSRPYEVNLAYAQSADVVNFLRSGDGDSRRFVRLIDELGEGDGFTSALSDAYALTPGQLERDWREYLNGKVQTLPLIVGGSTFWALAAILLFLAWRKRRKVHKQRLGEMAMRERADNAAIARIETKIREDTPMALFLDTRETEVPTVQHEGKEHTLH